MDMPLISVIVPVYDVENYLQKCVDSILQQTYRDLEVILVDDGATDECPSICDGYAKTDSRVTVIHKENGGVSSARNAGLDAAAGEYIVFMDADDYIDSMYIETLYREAVCCAVDLVCSNFTYVRGSEVWKNQNRESFIRGQKGEVVSENRMLKMAFVWGTVCSCLFSRRLIGETRFAPLRYGEDTLFLWKICCKCRLAQVSSYAGYYYIQRSGSAVGRAEAWDMEQVLKRRSDHLLLCEIFCERLPHVGEAGQRAILAYCAGALNELTYAAAHSPRRELRIGLREQLMPRLTFLWSKRSLLSAKYYIYILIYTKIPWLYSILTLGSKFCANGQHKLK